jgi:poly(3-hydroxyalkanoate) depolymerase
MGEGVPLVLCNGIGASLEVLDPLVERLNPDSTVVRFDVPGTGASPDSMLPYGFPYMAAVVGGLLRKLRLDGEGVDILGVSWGGALAQQFAFQNPRRCRRLILVSTGTGAFMVPGRPRVLAKMLTPRRFLDPHYAATIAGDLYGGTVRQDPSVVEKLFDRQLMAGSRVGYVHQLLAGAVWTSLFALPLIRQDTLILAGTDDPIVPVANARIMARLLPHATVHLHSGGHVDLITNAAALAPVIESFRNHQGTP